MDKLYGGCFRKWLIRLDEILHKADKDMLRQQQEFQAEEKRFREKWEAKAAAQKNLAQTFPEQLKARIKSVHEGAREVAKELIDQENRLTITHVVSLFAKKQGTRGTQQMKEEQFRLETVDDCVNALDQIRAQANWLIYGGGYNFTQGRGVSALLHASKGMEYCSRLDDLLDTVLRFQAELERRQEELIENSIRSYQRALQIEKKSLGSAKLQEMEQLESRQNQQRVQLESNLRMELAKLWPKECANYLQRQYRYFATTSYINLSDGLREGLLNRVMLFYDTGWIRSDRLRELLQKIMYGILRDHQKLLFPWGMSETDGAAWLFWSKEERFRDSLRFYVNTMMADVLSCVPVGDLTYTVVDPVEKGRSLSLFRDMEKRMPELLGKGICKEQEEISERIHEIREMISLIRREKLGNTYATIYDYAREQGEKHVQIHLLVLFDFPEGIGENLLKDLREILTFGGICGVYTYLVYTGKAGDNVTDTYRKQLGEIVKGTTMIIQDAQGFRMGESPIWSYCEDVKEEERHFLGQYLLFLEVKRGSQNLLPSALQQLIFAEDSRQMENTIAKVEQIRKQDKEADIDSLGSSQNFPKEMLLGDAVYPAALFSGCAEYPRLLENFGVGNPEEKGSGSISVPLLLDFHRGSHFYLECTQKNTEEVLHFTHQLIWKFLISLPAGKINFCVFDGKQRGNSMVPFLDFRQRCPEIFDKKIYTDPEDMYEQLRQINARMDEFIQEKLGNRYRNFGEYNQNMQKRPEAATVLLLYDFPMGMDARSMEYLMSILRNGKRCGVYVILCHNPEVSLPGYDSATAYYEKEIRENCERVECSDGRYFLEPYGVEFQMAKFPDISRLDAFAAAYEKQLQKMQKQGISYQDILPEELFVNSSAQKLSIPVGIGDRDEVVSLELGEGSSHHGLIAGATGSGKSTLLHTIIMSSMLKYSPDQLQLYLMDFKSGTEFNIYESVKLPHIRLLALDAMQEFGESILEELVREMEQRANLFKNTEGGGVTTIKDYVRATGKTMPRILGVIDEFQILFNDAADRKVAEHCAELAKRIVTEGRAFGIHLLMATQSMRGVSNMTLISGIVEQMLIRIGLKCGESDIRYLFPNGDCGQIQTMMKGAIGTAVMNLDYTEKPDTAFRVAYFDAEAQRLDLKKISEQFADYPCQCQVFEGKRTEKLLDYFRREGIEQSQEFPVRIHLGTPIKVAPPIAVTADKKRKHNLLVCGSDSRMADRVMDNYMISALLNQNASVYCADGDLLVDDESRLPFYQLLEKWSGRLTLAEERGDIIRMVDELYEQYQSRKKKNRKDVVFVLLRNLQFLDLVEMMLRGERVERQDYLEEEALQKDDFSDPMAAFDFDSILSPKEGEDEMPVGEKLIRLIESGSMYGIYFVISSLEYQAVRDSMCTYGENTLKHFPERIVFALSPADSEFLLDDLNVSGLQDNTVYFTDGVQGKIKLKPYLAPEVPELQEYLGISD